MIYSRAGRTPEGSLQPGKPPKAQPGRGPKRGEEPRPGATEGAGGGEPRLPALAGLWGETATAFPASAHNLCGELSSPKSWGPQRPWPPGPLASAPAARFSGLFHSASAHGVPPCGRRHIHTLGPAFRRGSKRNVDADIREGPRRMLETPLAPPLSVLTHFAPFSAAQKTVREQRDGSETRFSGKWPRVCLAELVLCLASALALLPKRNNCSLKCCVYLSLLYDAL